MPVMNNELTVALDETVDKIDATVGNFPWQRNRHCVPCSKGSQSQEMYLPECKGNSMYKLRI